MDFAGASDALSQQAQALLAMQRQIDKLADDVSRGDVLPLTKLRRMSKRLRICAENADTVAILLDGEVEVPLCAART